MCLGVPGQIVEIAPDPLGMTMGRVRFGGITKEVCLAYVPEAAVGDYVLVHVGFALSKLDEEQARAAWDALQRLADGEELRALEEPESP
jgi:hydrogenase expression/formation protein HypC